MEYEEKVSLYLMAKEYTILHRNFHSAYGEIDIIAQDKAGYLVFVEVRFRVSDYGGHPLETVDYYKQRRIKQTARYYLTRFRYPETTRCRFDVIGILGEELSHIEDAFC
jgi:putative endonuclease